jgi:hypothetical protein
MQLNGLAWTEAEPASLLQYEILANVSVGSNSAVSGFLRHVCFPPETGHWLARLARQKSAISSCEQPQQN